MEAQPPLSNEREDSVVRNDRERAQVGTKSALSVTRRKLTHPAHPASILGFTAHSV